MNEFFALPTAIQTSIIVALVIGLVSLIGALILLSKQKALSAHAADLEKQNGIAELQLAQWEEKLIENKAIAEQALQQKNQQLLDAQQKLEVYANDKNAAERQIGELRQQVEQVSELKADITALGQKLEGKQEELQTLNKQYAALKTEYEKESQHFEEKLKMLNEAEKRMGVEFENIANKIFEQKSEKFTQSSQTGLNQLLTPLKTQIDEFKRQITEQYVVEGKERASLKTEILGLKELNRQITQEASALTNALKGDNKQQGNWGEIVLERILQESGLRSGHEYEVQKHALSQEGKRYQPDVVVHLPNEKDIVIDSKVSLISYERFVNADDADIKAKAIKEHVTSVKGHIKGLSKKDYQELEGLRTLDYVLMFVPVEAAFISAVEEDPSLINLALENQIMLVSPTNLLVALRTIHNIWQYEYQNQNAAKIADRAKKMYDKLANFVADMEKVGRGLDQSTKAYEAAMNKLSSGRGNLLSQAESFKALGVNPTKNLKDKLVDDLDESED